MKQFIYKIAIFVVAIILIYEFTIGKQIKNISSKGDYFFSKEGRKEGIEKLRNEIKKGIQKERYLSREDAKLLNQFFKKIIVELQESEN
tara:strand:- start:201 stop:467 length:267 start_codon:yes stop_codon:yes gene_type:complete